MMPALPGVRRALECLAELTAAEEVLLRTVHEPPAKDGLTKGSTVSIKGNSTTPGSACCGGRLSYAHDRHDGGKAPVSGHHHPHARAHRGEDGNAQENASEEIGSSCGNSCSSSATMVLGENKEMFLRGGGLAPKTLRGAKVACRVAEAAHLLLRARS